MRLMWTSLPQHCWLLLAMFLLEAVGGDLLFDPNWGFDWYEITVPKELTFRKGERGVDSSLSYLLQIQGKKHVIHLWPKKFLLPRNLPVFSFSQEGSLIEDYPYIPNECNYMGSVEGAQESEATMSTCMGGLHGILNIDSTYYQIEPLRTSSRFEHVVYLLSKDGASNETCGVVDEETDEQTIQEEDTARISTFHKSYRHQKYLKLLLVFDTSRVIILLGNRTRVIYEAILLTSIIDTYFHDVRMRVVLKAIEIWSPYDQIYTQYPTLDLVLGQFVLYKRSSLHFRLPSDWAHLYLGKRFDDASAWSWGRVCEEYHAGSANSLLNVNLLGPATWTTHELGHAVGMNHDLEYCQCRGRKNCVMGSGRVGFSNCSYLQFFKHAAYKISYCLSEIPENIYVVKRCGNKIVEHPEQCDCGSIEECKQDLCCGPDCRWKKGVNCSTGLCCHKCDFLPSGYVCRKEENECDLAEYCNGASGYCPKDFYKQDGTPCRFGGLCFQKGCRSKNLQCQSIFGPTAKEGPPQCYNEVNMIGDQYGNCGINKARYLRCNMDNAICGRLQCINVNAIPKVPEHSVIIVTHLKRDNIICWGTGYHDFMKAHNIPDIGRINDGSFCTHKQVCMNKTCVDSDTLKFDCLPAKCKGRGACNNRKNCHCVYGWEPPFCEEVGFGGSIDSGPPGPRTEEPEPPPSFPVLYMMIMRIALFAISVIIVYFSQVIKKWCKNHWQKQPVKAHPKTEADQ
ncbi:disintegrin and metalloproteinase domain-containing protein 30 [Mesocricetus auratus]|uniref:Disintegrin and metalloproteinase domain-containing protein 30 n=1 Tax=Mesocricetus auratus TaxID=10036 RepID=A0A1U7RA09_MESAU|nr:disintegrin and metalloproteinase domain-containing protein 30 [Mesocricetus auratus]